MAEIKFDAGFETSKEGTVATLSYKDEDAFKANSEIPFTQLKAADAYRSDYIEAAGEKAKAVAEAELKKDSKLSEVHVSFPFSTSKRGSVNVKVERSHTFQIPNAEPGKPSSVTKSTMTVVTKDPNVKVGKTKVREWEDQLTKQLIK